MQQAPETERKPLIGIGPNMQVRADKIGGQLVEVLDRQAKAMTLALRLYREYHAECQQHKLAPKKPMQEVTETGAGT